MDFFILLVIAVSTSMIMVAIYVTVRSQVFGTAPSAEFYQFCENFLDRFVYKTPNKNRITMILADKGSESYEYLYANLDVSRHIFNKYLEELEKERRIEKLPDSGGAEVYKLGD